MLMCPCWFTSSKCEIRKRKLDQAVVSHTFDPSTGEARGRQRQADLCGFKASLVYRVNSKIAGDMQKPCLKPTPPPPPQKKKEKRRKGNRPLLRMPPIDLAILQLTLLPCANSESRPGALLAKAEKHHALTMPRTSNGLRCDSTWQFCLCDYKYHRNTQPLSRRQEEVLMFASKPTRGSCSAGPHT